MPDAACSLMPVQLLRISLVRAVVDRIVDRPADNRSIAACETATRMKSRRSHIESRCQSRSSSISLHERRLVRQRRLEVFGHLMRLGFRGSP